MFTFPVTLWIGGIFYEHTHRLLASVIGALTVGLFLWLLLAKTPKVLRFAGLGALILVILQGTLGGLTVLYKLPDILSVAHGVLGQTFFLLVLWIAFSLWWLRNRSFQRTALTSPEKLAVFRCSRVGFIVVAAIYMQLILGAVMRHTDSGLAALDFPTMGGLWFPSSDPAYLAHLNEARAPYTHLHPLFVSNIWIHFSHRVGALLVFSCVTWLVIEIIRSPARLRVMSFGMYAVAALTVFQILLGIWTIFSVRNPIITSLHVVVGALLLGTAFLLSLSLRYRSIAAP
jgi:cytochrome c oxidase assembly protein subunit 15